MQLRGSAADPGQLGRTDGLQTQGSRDGRTDCRPRAVRSDGRNLLKRLCILPIGVEIPRIIVSACELKFKEVTLVLV